MRRDSGGLAEAAAFTCATLAYIWTFRPNRWVLLALTSWAIFSIARRSESLEAAGWSPRRFAEALVAWRYSLLAGALALWLALQAASAEPDLAFRGAAYFLWCCLQQTVYQDVVYRRVRDSLGAGNASWSVAGFLFGAVHLPNPVLAPATFLWGYASSRAFERRPSVPALSLAQVLLSSLLYELTPYDWHHGFRVGPGYFS